ncbi:translation initiation factor IF-2 [Candidatus Daviesbacteria bacterium]|nr:translation initiation factor IF-2 [Candidatus Daviesbacteria bacterium]
MAEQTRPPIVTILGHVDHGKTSLLDFIRKSSVAAKEHGGITQAIGAYQVKVKSQKSKVKSDEEDTITFIDTPGHAAFEKMRSRGAKVADIAVLVVALDDGVMPQTVEAIKHIQEAKVSMIVALNKIDLPGIDIKVQTEKIKKQLSDQKVLVEEYGGDVPVVPVSAKTGVGVDKLLEMILLVAELNEIKGDPLALPVGVVIEANLDKFKGPIATILVRSGTLRKGDQIALGGVKSKIRGMFDFAGKPVDSAGPSTPVEVLGLEIVPEVGAALGEESRVKSQESSETRSLIDKLRQADTTTLNVVIKADKQGSLEAIEEALKGFNTGGEHVKVISSGTGGIMESDIKLAASTRSIVIGFNSIVVPTAQKIAENEHVLVRTYTIIYELIDELKQVVEEMLKVGAIEEVFGTAQIVAEFPYGKNERIAGCKVLDGNISKGPKARVVRGDKVIGEMKIKSIKKVKEEIVKVEKGDECGMIFEPQVDFQIGDLVQSFRTL